MPTRWARFIGEGGNLAVTQRGRMQYARRGGRINLDAIDNAAGVDTSDREVNLKVLLGQAIDAGDSAPDDRDALLADVTDDVAARVLEDVWPSDPPPGVAAQRRELVEELIGRDVDDLLARRLVARPDLAFIPDVAAVTADHDRPVTQVAEAFIEVGRELPLAQLAGNIERDHARRPLAAVGARDVARRAPQHPAARRGPCAPRTSTQRVW